MRAVLVFCEGRHDVFFVSRSLGAVAQGQWSRDAIRALPAPFGSSGGTGPGFIALQYGRRSLDELDLTAAAHAPAPTFDGMVRVPEDETLYFLVRCNGNAAAGRNLALIENITNLIGNGYLEPSGVNEIAFAFILDADDAGVEACESTFMRDYASCLAGNEVHHARWGRGRHGPMGLFVFHDASTLTGTLEDALGPLVGKQWPSRWQAAGAYLLEHSEADDRIRRKRAEYTKAQIGVTGQFLFPGDPMSQVIRKTKQGLPDEHFEGPVSRSLVDFLRAVPW